jgi:hypothetical protein
MTAVVGLIRTFGLAMRLQSAQPDLSFLDAYEHASAAVDASTAHVAPELLLAIAFVESRFDVTATSRVEGRKRRTGHYASTTPPANLNVRQSMYCGPLQTFAGSWSDCISLRDPHTAYAAGADELEHWLRDKRVRGDVTRALAGHGCGNHGVTTGKCNFYPQRVLWQQRRFALGLPAANHNEVLARSAPRS